MPEPPRQDWQTASDHCLADLVEFATHLNDHEQASLEAALHASGLLSARLGDDATVELANGELIALATEGVSHPISEHLAVTVPDRLIGEVDEGLVAKLLDSISCDLSSDAPTVASLNGTFRVGSVRGHHTKQQAECIGVTARRAALESVMQEARTEAERVKCAAASSEVVGHIVAARMEEILALARKQVYTALPDVELGAGIVLTGGGAQTAGVEALAERAFGMPVRIGVPVGFEGAAEWTSPPYATALGLLLYGAEQQQGKNQKEAQVLVEDSFDSVFGRVKRWLQSRD